jgi:hypothetical protein
MAKLSYLELTNRVLKRITQNEITDVTTASGQAEIITELINEAQNFLFMEDNWYSLYRTRKFVTVTYSAATIAAASGSPDTFTDSASGFVTAGFQDGQQIRTSGFSTNAANNSTWTLAASGGAAAGTLTLQTADTQVVTEALGDTVVVTAITYPVASDWGRTIDIMDMTNNRILIEDDMRSFDEDDPDVDTTNIPSHFTIQGSFYRFHFMPAGTYTMRERYWAVPATLATNTATSDLPIEVENLLILYAQYQINEYLNEFDQADRHRIEFERQLKRAKSANKRKIDKMRIFQGRQFIDGIHGIRSAQLPSTYDRRFR